MSPHCWNHKTSSTKKTKYLYLCQTEENVSPGIMLLWRQIKCAKERERGGKENDVCTLKRKLPTKIKILSFVYFDEIGFEEQIVKYLPKFGTYTSLVFLSSSVILLFFFHLTKVIWMSLVGITSSPLSLWRQGVCVCLSVVAGHGSLGTVAVWGSGTVILAMYTFIVGPWLPASSAISADLIHKPTTKARKYLM